jgi:alpha-mannosidase
MEGFNQMRIYPATWRLQSESPVSSSFVLDQDWPDVRVREILTVFHELKRVDLQVELLDWKGTEYREFRIAWPLKLQEAQVAYEVPFGIVEVGKTEMDGPAGERYVQKVSDIRPREVMDWFGASDASWGFTMSSDVAVFDYVDPTDNPVDYPVLQPVLLASRKSCHWEGNWYLQEGDHKYRFSFTSHTAGWRNGYHFGAEATHPLRAVEPRSTGSGGRLPTQAGFVSASDANVFVSTVKRAENGEGVILRAVEMGGVDTDLTLDWFTPILAASKTNMIEEGQMPVGLEDGRLSLRVGRHAIETVRLNVASWNGSR